EGVDAGLLGRDLGERVLHHGVGRVLTEGTAELAELRHGETTVFRQHGRGGAAEQFRELRHDSVLRRRRHGTPSIAWGRSPLPRTTKTPRAGARGVAIPAARGRARTALLCFTCVGRLR